MVRRRRQDRSLFDVLLPDSDKLWPDWLKRIDTLLGNEAVIETVASALEQRWPQSRTRGREGTPAEVALRMLILISRVGRVRNRVRRATRLGLAISQARTPTTREAMIRS